MRSTSGYGQGLLLAAMIGACSIQTHAQDAPPVDAPANEVAAPPEQPSAAPPPDPTADAPAKPALDPRLSTETGRDARVWPPDLLFDHRHIRLELDVPDMTEAKFNGVATLTMAAIARPRSVLTLDAGKGLTISRATVDGRPATFTHDRDAAKLTVTFDRPAEPNREITVILVYTADRPGGGGNGLTWSRDDSRTPEFDPMFHAQGQPEHNHLWFPCHDFPNDRITSEVVITVPAPYEAVSNGVLVSVTSDPDAAVPAPANPPKAPASDSEDHPSDALPVLIGATEANVTGTTTYHWRQDKPHASYLITLVVGRFDKVELSGPGTPLPNLSMPVYGAIGSGEALREIFGNTPEMVQHFAELFDYPYPWDQYSQIMCRNFSAGAMENTSASTFNAALVRGRRGSQDEIIAHELVHQWFGDLVGYRSWEHLWLGEGWATLGEALWAEHKRGEDAYQDAILQNFGAERSISGRRYWPRNAPMVSNRYRNPDSRFISGDNVYQKGGAVLHMLRMRLGERDFWSGVRLYLKRHAFEQVETDQFRLCMEEVSGQSLERFFDQWCKRPGHPNLEVDYTWTPRDPTATAGPGSLTVTAEQIQRIDADNPAYAFQLPVYAQFADDVGAAGEYVYLLCDSRVTTMTFDLPHRPKSMSIDPYLTVLCRKRVRTSLEAAADQLRRGPTFASRVQAADDLVAMADWSAVRVLAMAAITGATSPEGSRSRQLAPHTLAAAIDAASFAVHDDVHRLAAAWRGQRSIASHQLAAR